MKETDIIIPVYKPDKRLFKLLDMLEIQTAPVGKIILINTEQCYFDRLIAGTDFWHRYKNVIVRHISKREFDHGYTRKRAVSDSESEYFVMMTDDAIPADEYLLEKLLAPILEGKASMSYARQLPDEDCGIIERFTREFNYPGESLLKSKKDLPQMGIKTFFASNVCAAYDRAVYDELGGFVKHTVFNEDMIYARKLIDAGYTIAYAADAGVVHSHNYSGKQQFQRNFDLGVSHAQYPEVFEGIKTESEGVRLVEKTCRYLLKIKKPFLIVKLFWQSGCKYMGYFLGKRYKKLPFDMVKACSMNREYWK
ncbi:MAG: glycosyltransferase family 2 protein [Lachnospiraceae bacterium]|nr:glycosyltransferase family 2 protein [Lachnospiraceae bacterium]